MSKQYTDSESQTLALAAMLQSSFLVDQVATKGEISPEHYNPLIQSLFVFEPENTLAIYGSLKHVELGLKLLKSALGGNNQRDFRQALRYCLGLMVLEKQLRKSPELNQKLYSRLQHIHFNREHFSNDINDISHKVAGVYQDTISTLKTRIHVSGNALHLQSQQHADQIRSLLLAGIRAAMLWRQTGGKRWHLLLSRKRLLIACEQHLSELNHP